jgi:prolyl oligopeptidase PreP (S9A serine peptidase family)
MKLNKYVLCTVVRENILSFTSFYQVWYEGKDGTKVPMFIVRHKSTEFDGTAPAIQYGTARY